MSCTEYCTEILDLALGQPASPALETHLRSCAGCRTSLDEEQERLARIDAGLAQALWVEPSPRLLAQVRERVAREAESAGPAWLLPLAASLVALVVLVPLVWNASRPIAARHAPASEPKAEVNPQQAAGSREATRPLRVGRSAHTSLAARPHGAARPRSAASAPEPEVLVSPGAEAALQRYVAAIRDRHLAHETVVGAAFVEVAGAEASMVPAWPRPLDRVPAEAERVPFVPEIAPPTWTH